MLSFFLPSHDLMLVSPHPHFQVPEWTKCSNREKRKEKEKPFYSDSEAESGPTESADSGEESAKLGTLCFTWSRVPTGSYPGLCAPGCESVDRRDFVSRKRPPVSWLVRLAFGAGGRSGGCRFSAEPS